MIAPQPWMINLASAALGAGLLYLGLELTRSIRNKGKIWLIRANSNNRTGKVGRIRADNEGWQQPKGPYYKFEGNYAYLDRSENRPMFIGNEDTGFVMKGRINEAESLRQEALVQAEPAYLELQKKYPATLMTAKVGETDELDGSILASFLGNRSIERINESGKGLPWAIIAVVLGVVAIIMLTIIMKTVGVFKPGGS